MGVTARKSSVDDRLGLSFGASFVAETTASDLGLDSSLLAPLLESGPLCFLDFEATGLDPRGDDLIEAGALLLRPGHNEIQVFATFINTAKRLSPFIKRLTGISDADLDAAPDLAVVAPALDDFIGDAAVVAHNASFEKGWLRSAVSDRFSRHPFLDTVELFALVYPDLPNMKLDTLCRRKLDRRERHRALDDALDTLLIIENMFGESRDGDPAVSNALWALRSFLSQSPWRERLENAPFSRVVATRARPVQPSHEPLPPVDFDANAITSRLRDPAAGALVIDGYESREEQLELARRVYDCFTGRGGFSIRLCEAGTGIGKTLAYLAVAIPFVRKTGEQVIISTSSKLLQRQLIEKDIPAAARLMGYPDLRVTSIKGRANYLCRSRLDAFLDEQSMSLALDDPFATALVAAFSRSAGHGEVDRIPQVLFQMHPGLERCRREVTSGDASECSRQTCETNRLDCVLRSARNRLEGSEIAVTNHDLLLRWPPDYPPLRHLVVDEVHDLAERADAAYAQVAEAVEIVHRLDPILRARAASSAKTDPGLRGAAERALSLVSTVGEQTRILARAGQDRNGYNDELAIPFDGVGATWQPLVEAALGLAEELSTVGRVLAERAESDESAEAGSAEVLIDAAALLNTSFPQPPSRIVVRFKGLSRNSPRSWRLVGTPVSPAADFQCEVLDRVTTLFGTSATVSVGDDCRGSVGMLEFEERAAPRYRVEAPVQSPFDYRHNLTVVFLSDPTDRSRLVGKTAQAITTVASHLGGKTLGLFTSRDRLASVADRLDTAFSSQGITIIAPATGSADPHDLVRGFVETENAVLLGARAFWQGIDIPGDACRAVIIEKLPFDVPSDPLIQRRGQLIEEEGGNAFIDYAIPRMLLRLKQMIGRLIRTSTDSGIVVIIEPRSDKRYFQRLYDALPPDAGHTLMPLSELDDFMTDFVKTIGARPPP